MIDFSKGGNLSFISSFSFLFSSCTYFSAGFYNEGMPMRLLPPREVAAGTAIHAFLLPRAAIFHIYFML